jgi:hypothetical protein
MERAIKEFEAFLKQLPKSNLRDDANFWHCYSKEKAGYKSRRCFQMLSDFVENNKRANGPTMQDSKHDSCRTKTCFSKVRWNIKKLIQILKQESDEEISIQALYARGISRDEKAVNSIVKLYDSARMITTGKKLILPLAVLNPKRHE